MYTGLGFQGRRSGGGEWSLGRTLTQNWCGNESIVQMSPRVDGNTRTERFMRKWYPGTFCVALNTHVSKTSQKWSDFLLVLFFDSCFSCVLLAPIYKGKTGDNFPLDPPQSRTESSVPCLRQTNLACPHFIQKGSLGEFSRLALNLPSSPVAPRKAEIINCRSNSIF